MMTSLNEIREIDDSLLGNMPADEALIFEARAIIDPQLQENIAAQKKMYTLVRTYGRMKMRKQLDLLHQNLLDESTTFRRTILEIFSNP